MPTHRQSASRQREYCNLEARQISIENRGNSGRTLIEYPCVDNAVKPQEIDEDIELAMVVEADTPVRSVRGKQSANKM